MSHRRQTTADRTRTSSTGSPRAIVHKQILDAAASRPEAAMEAIADEVSGATTELVEQVLEEYGDPAETATEEGAGESPASDDVESEGSDGPQSDGEDGDTQAVVASDGGPAAERDGAPVGTEAGETSDTGPDPEAFTETQLETLRAIHARPEATQAELAAAFDVTSASISQRVTSIEGLEWSDRRAFTEALFGTPAGSDAGAVAAEPDGGTAAGTGAGGAAVRGDELDGSDGGSGADDTGESEPVSAVADQLDVLSARVDRLEHQLEDQSTNGVDLDSDLVHKVAHACLQSEAISEDEERRILEGMLASG